MSTEAKQKRESEKRETNEGRGNLRNSMEQLKTDVKGMK